MLCTRWKWRIAAGRGVRRSDLVGMAVVASALLAGCAQASSTIHVPSPTATATPLPPAPLSWQLAPQQLSIPAGMGSFPGAGLPTNFAVAPGDGNTAYACAVTLGAGAREASASVWATHDRAAHWTEASNVASGQVSSASNMLRFCSMTVDQVDAKTAALVVVWQSTPDDFDLWHTSTLVTFDGGATWQLLTSAEPAIIIQLATWQGNTYAIREVGVGCGSVCPVPGQRDLMVSRDHLRTWQPIDQPIVASQQSGHPFFRAFWVNPSNGEILTETDEDVAGGAEQLWDTRDGGQHWTHLPAPAIQSVVVEAPAAGQPWRICGTVVGTGSNPLTCSVDGGETWAAHPGLDSVVAIADDGAVLATLSGNPSAIGGSQQVLLYRLSAGATAWQALGTTPLTTIWYAPAPGTGVLWSLQLNGTPTANGLQSRFFTAAYP